jgi:hypothetical protein
MEGQLRRVSEDVGVVEEQVYTYTYIYRYIFWSAGVYMMGSRCMLFRTRRVRGPRLDLVWGIAIEGWYTQVESFRLESAGMTIDIV